MLLGLVNDQPVGIGLLRQIGDSLVEIVGQFEQHGLLDPATHGEMLDEHGGHDRPAVAEAWRAWRETAVARQAAESEIAAAKRDEEFLRHAAQELSGLAPQPGEEAALALTGSPTRRRAGSIRQYPPSIGPRPNWPRQRTS